MATPQTARTTQVTPAPKFATGVVMIRDGNTFRVDSIVPNSGGAAAGVMVGDLVIGMDGVPAAEIKLEGVTGGEEGSSVKFTLLRKGVPITAHVRRITPVATVKRKLSLDIADMSEVLERKISP